MIQLLNGPLNILSGGLGNLPTFQPFFQVELSTALFVQDPWLLGKGNALKAAKSSVGRWKFDAENAYHSSLKRNTPIPGAAWKNMSDALLSQVLPELSGTMSKDLGLLADADWKDVSGVERLGKTW